MRRLTFAMLAALAAPVAVLLGALVLPSPLHLLPIGFLFGAVLASYLWMTYDIQPPWGLIGLTVGIGGGFAAVLFSIAAVSVLPVIFGRPAEPPLPALAIAGGASAAILAIMFFAWLPFTWPADRFRSVVWLCTGVGGALAAVGWIMAAPLDVSARPVAACLVWQGGLTFLLQKVAEEREEQSLAEGQSSAC